MEGDLIGKFHFDNFKNIEFHHAVVAKPYF